MKFYFKRWHLAGLFLAIAFSCNNPVKNTSTDESVSAYVLFEDTFGIESEGEYVENIIHLPPPKGLGYDWKVLPGGHKPVNWVHSDELELSNPKKGFWVIPPDSGFMQQGGRSHNSVLFVKKPIPDEVKNYEISFRQNRADNDPIMFVLGADKPDWDKGFEFGCMIQVPGTDSTTNDAYVLGAIGDSSIVEGAAFLNKWADHKIEVAGENVKWTCNKIVMAEGAIAGLEPGFFGIRQRYERNTKYDDFKIIIRKRD